MSADALPTEEDQLEAAVEAPETGISQQDDAPFNINTIEDLAVRAEVEKYQKQLQGAFTTKTQELAEQRAEMAQYKQAHDYIQGLNTDPTTRQQLLQQLMEEAGYTLPDDEQVDPVDQVTARQDAIEARLAQRDLLDQQNQFIADMEAQVEKDLAALGSLTDEQQKLVVDAAVSRPLIDDRYLDVKSVYQELMSAAQGLLKAQRASKKAAQVSPVGVEGRAKVDLSDPDARQAHMLAIVQAAQE